MTTTTVYHESYGEITFIENDWTGKKSIKVNGADATRVAKKKFLINGKEAILKGSYLFGARLEIDGEIIELTRKPKWYEIVLSFFPIVFILTWGNVKTLCNIFPIVGGAIGGLIGGLTTYLSMTAMRRTEKTHAKILIGLASIILSILAAFLVALLIINTLGTGDDWVLR